MTILSPCIDEKYSETNSLLVCSRYTGGVHRERTYPTKSRELSNRKRRRWEICPHRLGRQWNHLESVS